MIREYCYRVAIRVIPTKFSHDHRNWTKHGMQVVQVVGYTKFPCMGS